MHFHSFGELLCEAILTFLGCFHDIHLVCNRNERRITLQSIVRLSYIRLKEFISKRFLRIARQTGIWVRCYYKTNFHQHIHQQEYKNIHQHVQHVCLMHTSWSELYKSIILESLGSVNGESLHPERQALPSQLQ